MIIINILFAMAVQMYSEGSTQVNVNQMRL